MIEAETDREILKVLIIEDDNEFFLLMENVLSKDADVNFQITRVNSLREGLDHRNKMQFDAVLLDLSLPDSQGAETFDKIQIAYHDSPIVILSSNDDHALALDLVRKGCQEYLIKGYSQIQTLAKTIRYSYERFKLKERDAYFSSHDILTGLYNRRVFLEMGLKALHAEKRRHEGLYLGLIDMDGLKLINDRYGHRKGDEAIKATAKILDQLVRESDILARIGGDEFAFILNGAKDSAVDIVTARCEQLFEQYNAKSHFPFHLSVSMGFARFDIQKHFAIECLMEEADQKLYEIKRQRKQIKALGDIAV